MQVTALELIVRHYDGRELRYKAKPSTPLNRLFFHASKAWSLDLREIQFLEVCCVLSSNWSG